MFSGSACGRADAVPASTVVIARAVATKKSPIRRNVGLLFTFQPRKLSTAALAASRSRATGNEFPIAGRPRAIDSVDRCSPRLAARLAYRTRKESVGLVAAPVRYAPSRASCRCAPDRGVSPMVATPHGGGSSPPRSWRPVALAGPGSQPGSRGSTSPYPGLLLLRHGSGPTRQPDTVRGVVVSLGHLPHGKWLQ